MSDVTSGLPAAGGGANETVTPVSEPISVGAGDAVSFDQLDSMQENTSGDKKPAKEPKESKEKKPDTEAEEKPAKSASKQEKKEEVESAKKAAKMFKVKRGEDLIDLAADGSLEIEKDGKTIPVTVQELVNSFHGKSEISRRLTEIDIAKKKNESDKKTIDTFVDRISEFYRADKPLELIDFLVSTAGLDPAMYRMKLLDTLAPEVEAMNSKTAEEKKAYHLELENQYLKKQQQQKEQEGRKTEELRRVESEVTKIRQSRNLDEKQFYALYRELVDVHGRDESSLTPQDVAEYADRKSLEGGIKSQIEAVNSEYAEAEVLAKELADEMLANSALTAEDLEEIIKSIVTDTSEDDLKEKLKETPKKERAPKNPQSDPVSFDELM